MDQHDLTSSLYWVLDCRLAQDFPSTDRALDEPDGLLAIGGDLSPERILNAYMKGIFPWYSDGQPILWWTPNPRSVLEPDAIHISRSLAKTIRNGGFEVSFDRCFERIVDACAAPRTHQGGTWITTEMRDAYCQLHERGAAHSLECWRDGELCGGLYGIAIGSVFFGESMFSHVRDASKVTFAQLCTWLDDWNYRLIDCQIHTSHLEHLGARRMARSEFEAQLAAWVGQSPAATAWQQSGKPL